MEGVLEVYNRPYDETRPLVCLDEASKQLIGKVAQPLPAAPGRLERFDYEDTRNSTANLFMAFEPLSGWRHVKVTERKTATDFAHFLRLLSDGPFRQAEKIVLVCDNLNTHMPASLYEAFEPAEVRHGWPQRLLADRASNSLQSQAAEFTFKQLGRSRRW